MLHSIIKMKIEIDFENNNILCFHIIFIFLAEVICEYHETSFQYFSKNEFLLENILEKKFWKPSTKQIFKDYSVKIIMETTKKKTSQFWIKWIFRLEQRNRFKRWRVDLLLPICAACDNRKHNCLQNSPSLYANPQALSS